MIYQIANMINNSYFVFQSQKTHSIPLTILQVLTFNISLIPVITLQSGPTQLDR